MTNEISIGASGKDIENAKTILQRLYHYAVLNTQSSLSTDHTAQRGLPLTVWQPGTTFLLTACRALLSELTDMTDDMESVSRQPEWRWNGCQWVSRDLSTMEAINIGWLPTPFTCNSQSKFSRSTLWGQTISRITKYSETSLTGISLDRQKDPILMRSINMSQLKVLVKRVTRSRVFIGPNQTVDVYRLNLIDVVLMGVHCTVDSVVHNENLRWRLLATGIETEP